MNKQFIVLGLGLLMSLSAFADDFDKMTGSDLLLIDQYKRGVPGDLQMKRIPSDKPISVIVTLASASDINKLKKEGYEIVSSRGKVVIILIPVERLSELSRLPYVKKISISKEVEFTTDVQRSSTGLEILQSNESPAGFPLTGKGVVTGLFDSGIDVNHINFRDENGESRIKDFYEFKDENGRYHSVNLNRYVTDNEYAYHGTHVLGIMAGSYKGELDYSYLGNDASNLYKHGNNPFFGVATESDIVACAGPLTSVNILTGIERIIAYSENNNQPAVVNLSIGTQSGWHDGLSPESEYMGELGKDAIIVIAAGNDGLKNNCITGYFSEETPEVKTLLLPPVGEGYEAAQGEIDIWGSGSEGYEVDLIIYDVGARRIVKSFPLNTNTDALPIYLTTSDVGEMYGPWHEDAFDLNYKTSYIGYLSGVHEENNRFNLVIHYTLQHARESSHSRLIGIAIRGKEGDRCDIYHYSPDLTIGSNDQKGFSDGTSRGTINDFACADNILAVGSYNNRSSYATLSGRVIDFEASMGMDKVGDISGFSSWGDRVDGVELPHVCAPGSGIVSSISTPYIETNSISTALYTASCNDGKRDNYWGIESGTSMAAPYVAGVVALWLQANPGLTIDQVKEIVSATSIRDEFVENDIEPMRWGAGKINPIGGLEYIMNNFSGVESVYESNVHDFIIINEAGQVKIYSGCEDKMRVNVVSIDGTIMTSQEGYNNLTIDTNTLNSGLYILTIADCHSNESHKFFVK